MIFFFFRWNWVCIASDFLDVLRDYSGACWIESGVEDFTNGFSKM